MSNEKKLKIAIVAHSLRVAGGLAVGKNFIKALGQVSPQYQFLIVVPANLGYESIALPASRKFIIYHGNRTPLGRICFDKTKLIDRINDFEPDVVFCMTNACIKGLDFKQAVLVQDSHMLYDEKHYKNELFMGKFKWRYQKSRMRKCLDDIDLVFCQTPVAQKRFSEVFNYPSDKIKLMPNAVSEFTKSSENHSITVPQILQDKRYFNLFYLAKFYAHKNFEILIDLFRYNTEKLKDVRCIITISPEQHKNAPKFLNNIKKHGLEDKIVNVGPLKQEELAGYFGNCDALLFPTLLESFSGTYLEAMHFGLPILTSDLDFARYICGDAAIYFNPWEAGNIAQKIVEFKNRPILKERLVEKGKQRMTQFFKTWEDITVDVIKELELLD